MTRRDWWLRNFGPSPLWAIISPHGSLHLQPQASSSSSLEVLPRAGDSNMSTTHPPLQALRHRDNYRKDYIFVGRYIGR